MARSSEGSSRNLIRGKAVTLVLLDDAFREFGKGRPASPRFGLNEANTEREIKAERSLLINCENKMKIGCQQTSLCLINALKREDEALFDQSSFEVSHTI